MLPTYAQEKVVYSSPILKEACIPPYSDAISYGPTKVELGSINNTSNYYSEIGSNNFYTDYSSTSFTDIYDNQENTLIISLEPNKNRVVRAWIDYDNNGVFSDNEFIRNSSNGINESSISISFNIPSNAIKNTYLRLRILVEFIATESHCSGIYGEIEDYAVRIVSKTPPSSNDGFSIGRVGINTDQPQATLDIRENLYQNFQKDKHKVFLFRILQLLKEILLPMLGQERLYTILKTNVLKYIRVMLQAGNV
ncbi:GEVED domain-containing protein [Bergeyella porcorum]